ncbi:hypothetical protein [Pseudoflavitalea rhizosphaerae]|uniref:hypothetical protein n=1 Tax=Pseudoflavitalea rhizosphaerae TaxID=1884793 RepID=UPI000F8EEFC9|nr:hypothetical protein [Pseudoflavitalea rhizosphaerae]
MKKSILILALCLPVALISSSYKTLPATISSKGDWMKSKTGTWPGMKDGKTYWYKLDKKAGLWWSTDGKKWEAVGDGAWADKDGKWLKIHEGKLVWSTDGNTWSEVPEWKWEGSDGKWYKFDNNWQLWVK